MLQNGIIKWDTVIMMIRKDCSDIDEETFLNVVLPANKVIHKYVVDNFLYDYVAFYLATYYRMDAMWECKMEQEVNSALCSLCNFESQKMNYKKIKNILKEKYKLEITNEKPLRIKEL